MIIPNDYIVMLFQGTGRTPPTSNHCGCNDVVLAMAPAVASSDGPLGSFVHFEAEHQNLMKLLNLKFGAFKYGMFLFHTWDDPNLTLVLRCFGSAGRM